jgi:hypothetical protein
MICDVRSAVGMKGFGISALCGGSKQGDWGDKGGGTLLGSSLFREFDG